VGRSITVNGISFEIVGVLPQDFRFLDRPDDALFIPMQLDRSKTRLGGFGCRGIARLRPGVSVARANADFQRLVPVALRSFSPPDGFSGAQFEKARIQASLHPLKNDVIGNAGPRA
jgi:hypothetical protein